MKKATKHTNYISTKELVNFNAISKPSKKNFIEIKKLPKGPIINVYKRFITTPELAWVSGFYFAEGSRLEASIGISNCDLYLLFKFREVVNNLFNLEDEDWQIFVRTNVRALSQIRHKYCELFGSDEVKVYFTKLANNDNIEIRVNNVPLTIIFHNLIAKVIKNALNDKNLALEFLKGYEAGDGSINTRKGCLHDINITVKDKKMKNTLKKLFFLLYKVNMHERRTKGAYEIWYSNITTITKLILDGHFSDHKQQWLKLLNSYSKKEYTRSHLRYWRVINNNYTPVLEIARKTDRSHWSVRDAMNKDVKLGFVTSQRKVMSNGYSYKVYRLKENGAMVIDKLKAVGISE